MSAALHITHANVEAERIRRGGFASFVKRAWSIAEPGVTLLWSWHMQAICDELETLWSLGGPTRREPGTTNRDLVINVPPGMSKSMLVSVLWTAWVWTLDPGHRFIVASHNERVVLRDAEKMRTLVKSSWYRERWPHVAIPEGKAQSDAVSVFRTTAGGQRISATVRGKLTGDHGDTLIVDDPNDPQRSAAASGIELDETIDWFGGKASTRFRDHTRKARVLIMQRLHERDLAGHMIERGARVLCLPMRFEPEHPNRWAGDPRTMAGELMCPQRMPADVLTTLERDDLGPTKTAAQMQQRPSPAGGSIFRAEWFGIDDLGRVKPDHIGKLWTVLPPGGTFDQSWDFKAKDVQTGSYVCGQCWYSVGPNHYLVDQVRRRIGFNETLGAVKAFSIVWPRAVKKYFEDKAAGSAIGEVLRKELPGIEMVEPNGDKTARAMSTEPLWAAGNVFLPHPTDAIYPDGRRGAPWIAGFVAEHLAFPNGANDDQVDTASQKLNRHGSSWGAKWGKALDAVKAEMQGRSQ